MGLITNVSKRIETNRSAYMVATRALSAYPLSWACWAFVPSNTFNQVFYPFTSEDQANYGGTAHQTFLKANGEIGIWHTPSSGGPGVAVADTFPRGEWAHFGWVFNSSGHLEIYVNGASVYSDSTGRSFGDAHDRLRVGVDSGWSTGSYNYLAHPFEWHAEVTAGQMAQLAAGLDPRSLLSAAHGWINLLQGTDGDGPHAPSKGAVELTQINSDYIDAAPSDPPVTSGLILPSRRVVLAPVADVCLNPVM